MRKLICLSVLGLAAATQAAVAPEVRREIYRREAGFFQATQARLESLTSEKRSAQLSRGQEAIDAQGRRVRFEDYITRPRADQIEHHFLTYRDGRTDRGDIQRTFNQDLPYDWWAAVSNVNPLWLSRTSAVPPYYVTDEVMTLTNGQDTYRQSRQGGGWYYNGNLTSNPYYYYFNTYDVTANGVPKLQIQYNGAGLPLLSLFANYTIRLPGPSGALQVASTGVGDYDGTLLTITNGDYLGRDMRLTFADGSWMAVNSVALDDQFRSTDFWTSTLYFDVSLGMKEFEGRRIELFGRTLPFRAPYFMAGFPPYLGNLTYP
jgi:hypothetical protein